MQHLRAHNICSLGAKLQLAIFYEAKMDITNSIAHSFCSWISSLTIIISSPGLRLAIFDKAKRLITASQEAYEEELEKETHLLPV